MSLLEKLEQHYWMHQAMKVLKYNTREGLIPEIDYSEFPDLIYHGIPVVTDSEFPKNAIGLKKITKGPYVWKSVGYNVPITKSNLDFTDPDDTPVINPNTVFPTYPWKRDISMETRKQVTEDIIKNNFPDDFKQELKDKGLEFKLIENMEDEEKTDDVCDCASNHMFKWYTGTEGDKDNPGNHYIRILCDHSRTEVLRIWGVTRPGKTWTERPNLEDEWFGGTKNTDLSYICPNCNQDRSFKKVPDEGLKCRYCKYIYFPKDVNAGLFIRKNRDRMADAEILYWTKEGA